MKPTIDPSVSLLAKLRHVARQQGLAPGSMLLLYVQQGFLARLEASAYAEQFVVKGGLSLYARYQAAARPTQDLDLAASGLPNTPEAVKAALLDILAQPYLDGLTFNPEAVTTREMQIESQYVGVAAQVTAQVGRAKQNLPLDISFGNVITPAPVQLAFPNLLLPQPVQVRVYPLETVVAEKFAALLELGLLTTRMKDLYDLWVISGREVFEARGLSRAVRRSFQARNTPEVQTVFTAEFRRDATMQGRWAAYLRKTGLQAPLEFSRLMEELEVFLLPISNEKTVLDGIWQPERGRWEE